MFIFIFLELSIRFQTFRGIPLVVKYLLKINGAVCEILMKTCFVRNGFHYYLKNSFIDFQKNNGNKTALIRPFNFIDTLNLKIGAEIKKWPLILRK